MNSDDPKLTAYALDELPPEERREIEAALAEHSELAQEIDELKSFTAALRRQLQQEAAAPLTAEQRMAILRRPPIPPRNVVVAQVPWWRSAGFVSAAAACVVVGISAWLVGRAQSPYRNMVTAEKETEPGVRLWAERELPATIADSPTAPEAAGPANPRWANQASVFKSKAGLAGEFSVNEPTMPAKPASPFQGGIAKSGSGAPFAAPSLQTAIADAASPAFREPEVRKVAAGSLRGGDFLASASRSPAATGSDHAGLRRGEVPGGRLAELERKAALLPAESAERDALRREIAQVRKELERVQADQDGASNREAYDAIVDNPFLAAGDHPLSTFSVDVDTASYSNVRRFFNSNVRPPKGAIRIEELVNYFRYDYPQPIGRDPFACALEVATCPWAPDHRLVRIGLKGREISRNQRPAANLVFLIDVSGSMEPENKLPLVRDCLRLLTDQLGADDSVSIAVYAGASGCVLEPTQDKEKVRAALDQLGAGGSTNGAAGIQLAYDLAQRAFKKGGVNRVILCTDGDFNVGISDQSQLVSMIQDKAKTGVFLSVLGFGFGNLQDSTLEKLADKGNGTYGYIDTISEGRRLFVEQMVGTLVTIAKDVKVQVEFNPAQVSSYRLIGYENRLLAKQDFNDDRKDAGEIGAGHTVTALYEVVPAGKPSPTSAVVDELKYGPPSVVVQPSGDSASREMLTVKVRYKQPAGEESTKLEFPLTDPGTTWDKSSRDFRWAAAVAGFGMMLRESPHKGSLSWSLLTELAVEGRRDDGSLERQEFVLMMDRARSLVAPVLVR